MYEKIVKVHNFKVDKIINKYNENTKRHLDAESNLNKGLISLGKNELLYCLLLSLVIYSMNLRALKEIGLKQTTKEIT